MTSADVSLLFHKPNNMVFDSVISFLEDNACDDFCQEMDGLVAALFGDIKYGNYSFNQKDHDRAVTAVCRVVEDHLACLKRPSSRHLGTYEDFCSKLMGAIQPALIALNENDFCHIEQEINYLVNEELFPLDDEASCFHSDTSVAPGASIGDDHFHDT